MVQAQLESANKTIDEKFACTEVSADNFTSIVASPLVQHNRDSIARLCKHFLLSNPDLQGIAMAYEPDFIEGTPNGFVPYFTQTDDGLMYKDLATTTDYRHKAWYSEAFSSGKTQWSEPFIETYGRVITSCCVPVKAIGDKIVGVAVFDLNLGEISDEIQSIKPYPNSNIYVVSDKGTYVVHPDKDSILVSAMPGEMLKKILSSVEQTVPLKVGKETVYAFHATNATTGWTVVMSIPKNDMGQNLAHMIKFLIFYMFIGILLLVLVCYVVISRLTRPLEVFASAAKEISHGKMHTDLPVIKDHNELYDLRQALSSMEVSLDEYIKQLEETTDKKAKIENELNIARAIQLAMVHKIFPPFPDRSDVDIFASLTPAQAVGGDLYDFVLVGDTLMFCIGDVSGKGVPASLFMAITRALYRNMASTGKQPAEIAKGLNDAIADNNAESMFVTMFIGACNLKTGEFTACNCGHNAPVTNGTFAEGNRTLVKVTDEPHYLSGAPINIPIGVFKGFDYKQVTMTLSPGTAMLLYTDGITEAENVNHELFGEDRLIETMHKASRHTSSEEIINTVLSDVKGFTKEAQQSDDITMLCLRYKG